MTLSPIQSGSITVQPKSFLQSQFWAGFKCAFGWSSLRFRVLADEAVPQAVTSELPDAESAAAAYELSVLVRKLAGPFTFAYIPHGPETEYQNASAQGQLVQIGEALKKMLPRSCLFVRFDPGWYNVGFETINPDRPEFATPLVKASDVQPPDTVVLDLSCTVVELLARMKPKWRYNIKLAEKKNVVIAEEGSAGLDTFFNLYQQTATRDRIAVHPKGYYAKLFELASRHQPGDLLPDLRLWVARHEGQALACIVTLFYGTTATYLYGASSDEKRNLMPAYALQWTAIRAAKAAGCLEYDMYGIPPTNDDQHPMAGLYRFKTGFGGQLRHYPGSWDFVYRPFVYAVFRAAERLRLLWHKKIRKSRR